MRKLGFRELALSIEHGRRSGLLPGDHKDPFHPDRQQRAIRDPLAPTQTALFTPFSSKPPRVTPWAASPNQLLDARFSFSHVLGGKEPPYIGGPTGKEGMRLQFRSEFFNVLNHTNLGIPNQQSNSSAFGTITTAYPARQIQFALKLLF